MSHSAHLAARAIGLVFFCIAFFTSTVIAATKEANFLAAVRVGIIDFRSAALADAFRTETDRELQDALAPARKMAVIEYRSGVVKAADIRAAVREVIAFRPQVVYATSLVIAREFRAIDKSTPLVFSGAADPRRFEIIDSLGKPGRQTTGFVVYADTEVKRLELLRQAIPSVSRVAMLFDPTLTTPDVVSERISKAASIGIKLIPIHLDVAMPVLERTLRHASPDAVDVPTSDALRRNVRPIIDLLRKLSLPSSFWGEDFARLGGLFSYGPVDVPYAKKAAELIALVIGGHNAGDIPVEISKQFVLAVNLTTARALKVKPAPSFLKRATVFYE